MTSFRQSGWTTAGGLRSERMVLDAQLRWRWIGITGVGGTQFVERVRQSAETCGFVPADDRSPRANRVRIRCYKGGHSWLIVRVGEDSVADQLLDAVGLLSGSEPACVDYSAAHERRANGIHVVVPQVVVRTSGGTGGSRSRRLDDLVFDPEFETAEEVYWAAEQQMLDWVPITLGLTQDPIVFNLDDELWEHVPLPPVSEAESERVRRILGEVKRAHATTVTRTPRGVEVFLITENGRTRSILEPEAAELLLRLAKAAGRAALDPRMQELAAALGEARFAGSPESTELQMRQAARSPSAATPERPHGGSNPAGARSQPAHQGQQCEDSRVAARVEAVIDVESAASLRRQLGSSPDAEEAVLAVRVLLANNGTASAEVFAERLGVMSFRVGGLISKLQELLNRDGYEVIGYDPSAREVHLDREKLAQLFEVNL